MTLTFFGRPVNFQRPSVSIETNRQAFYDNIGSPYEDTFIREIPMYANRFQQSLAQSKETNTKLVAHPSLESHAIQLIDDARQYRAEVELIQVPSLSAETIQLERQKQNELINDLKDQLGQVLPSAQGTGMVHHYLIDTHALSSGDEAAQSTLKALLSASLRNQDRPVVAALPLSGEISGGQAEAIAASLEHYGFEVFTDRKAYVNYLAAA